MSETAQELYKDKKRQTLNNKNKHKAAKIHKYQHEKTYTPGAAAKLQIDSGGRPDRYYSWREPVRLTYKSEADFPANQNLEKYPILNLKESLKEFQFLEISKFDTNIDQQKRMLEGRKFKNHVSKKLKNQVPDEGQSHSISYDRDLQAIFNPKAYQKTHTLLKSQYLKEVAEHKKTKEKDSDQNLSESDKNLSESDETAEIFNPFDGEITHLKNSAHLDYNRNPWYQPRHGDTWRYGAKRVAYKAHRNKGYRTKKWCEEDSSVVINRCNQHLDKLEISQELGRVWIL